VLVLELELALVLMLVLVLVLVGPESMGQLLRVRMRMVGTRC
jgi:Sec-independent protein translocase protein TatA